MKTLIIYGNIAAGKSSVCKHLAHLLPDYRHVCLDNYRVELWKEQPHIGAGQRDLLAQERCLNNMHGPMIYETTAVTRFFKRAKLKLEEQGQELLYIHLDCRPSTCIRRYTQRLASGHIQAPFAWGNYSIEQSIYYFHERQLKIAPNIKINTSKVRPSDAAKFIASYLSK